MFHLSCQHACNSRLQLSCNCCSRLTMTRELMKLSCKLSLVISHATLVLVWPGHESWWNSHVNSCSHTSFNVCLAISSIVNFLQSVGSILDHILETGTCNIENTVVHFLFHWILQPNYDVMISLQCTAPMWYQCMNPAGGPHGCRIFLNCSRLDLKMCVVCAEYFSSTAPIQIITSIWAFILTRV